MSAPDDLPSSSRTGKRKKSRSSSVCMSQTATMNAPDDLPSSSRIGKRKKSRSSSESISQPSPCQTATMIAFDDLPFSSRIGNRKKSRSMSQPSTSPPPRPSTSNGQESGHTLGGHRLSELHSSGQLGNHHSRRRSTGRSSTDSHSSTSVRRSSHGDNKVRSLSTMRDRVLVSNANAMARGMSLNELNDTTTTSSSPSPHMNGHDQSNTDDDQQRAGMSNGSRKKKKKKYWHRSSEDTNLIGWNGLYPNLSRATNQALDSNPGLESKTSDELQALSRRGLMVYPREAQGSEAAAEAPLAAAEAAEPTRNPHPQPQQQPPQSLATSPSPMSSSIESSLSPNSELNRNLTPGSETGLVPELEQHEPPPTTASNSPTAAATPRVSSLTATIGQDTELDKQAKSVADDAMELQSEEEQMQQVEAGPSTTSSVSGKRQGSLQQKHHKEKKKKRSNKVKEARDLSPRHLPKRHKHKKSSRSRSKSLCIQDLPPKWEQATSRSKSHEALAIDLHDSSSSETVAEEEAPPESSPSSSGAKSETSFASVYKFETPSPNAVKPKRRFSTVPLYPPMEYQSETPSTSVAKAVSRSVGEPASFSEAKPMLPPNSNIPSSSILKRKATDIFYRMPFDYGWRRELVLPSQETPKRRTGDVFFIAPNGRKLRSREDIKPLLEGELTIDRFCFQRVAQEVGPQYETVRHAIPSVNRSKQNEQATALADQQQEPTVTGKRVPKPKVPKGASPPSEGWTSTSAVKGKVQRVLSSNGGNQAAAGASVSRKSSKSSNMSTGGDPYVVWPERQEISEEPPPGFALEQMPSTLEVYEISDDSEEENDDYNNASSSSSVMEIAEEVELHGQLVPPRFFDEQEQAQMLERQGQNHTYRPLRDMDVVVIGGRKAVFVRGPPEDPPTKLVPRLPDLTSYDRIYRKRIQAKRMTQTLAISVNDAHIGVNVLAAVMRTMNMKDRVTMSQVCTSWAMVSRDNRVWNRVMLQDTVVKNWSKLLMEMARHRTHELDMKGVILDPNDRMSSELRLLRPLRILRTDATTNEFLKLVQTCLPKLQELRTTCVSAHLNLNRLERMRQLRVLRINMTHPKAQILKLNTLLSLHLLTELSIRGVTNLKLYLNLSEMKELRLLQVVKLGFCEDLNYKMLGRYVLSNLKALHTLRIENDHRAMTLFPVDEILRGLAVAGGVKRLELINVDVDTGFGKLLAKCDSVRSLLLAPKCLHNTATMTNAVMQAIKDNADHLVTFRLVLVTQLLSATENLYKGTQKNVIPVQRPVPGISLFDDLNQCSAGDNCQEEEHSLCVAFLPVERLEQILNEMLPTGCVSVAKVAMSETTNVQFLEPGVFASTKPQA